MKVAVSSSLYRGNHGKKRRDKQTMTEEAIVAILTGLALWFGSLGLILYYKFKVGERT
jgi:hypothetical protein